MRRSIWKRLGTFPMHLKQSNKRKCNLCSRVFRDSSGFRRFCGACREESELFRYGGWLKETDWDRESVA